MKVYNNLLYLFTLAFGIDAIAMMIIGCFAGFPAVVMWSIFAFFCLCVVFLLIDDLCGSAWNEPKQQVTEVDHAINKDSDVLSYVEPLDDDYIQMYFLHTAWPREIFMIGDVPHESESGKGKTEAT